ncbi:phosphoethanolamine n-methyltransferase [Moniliophthora roreri]|nr:phosphoethanolamine n-methyltransferase [Moniliophthora roreri]
MALWKYDMCTHIVQKPSTSTPFKFPPLPSHCQSSSTSTTLLQRSRQQTSNDAFHSASMPLSLTMGNVSYNIRTWTRFQARLSHS